MKRVVLALLVGLFAVFAGTNTASAAPINIDVNHSDSGGVVVTATIVGTPIVETITTGQLATSEFGGPGLCASGVIHSSCTPAG